MIWTLLLLTGCGAKSGAVPGWTLPKATVEPGSPWWVTSGPVYRGDERVGGKSAIEALVRDATAMDKPPKADWLARALHILTGPRTQVVTDPAPSLTIDGTNWTLVYEAILPRTGSRQRWNWTFEDGKVLQIGGASLDPPEE